MEKDPCLHTLSTQASVCNMKWPSVLVENFGNFLHSIYTLYLLKPRDASIRMFHARDQFSQKVILSEEQHANDHIKFIPLTKMQAT